MENVMGTAVLSGHVIKLTGCDVSGAVTTNCRRLHCSCCCYFLENTTYRIANFCNVSEKNSANRAHFHRLPRNRVLRRRWLEKCGRRREWTTRHESAAYISQQMTTKTCGSTRKEFHCGATVPNAFMIGYTIWSKNF